MFVQRETDPASADFGRIKGVYRMLQEGIAEEELADDAAEVVAYLEAIDPPPPPPEAQLQRSLEQLVQSHLDAQAQQYGYDSIFSAVTYADEPAVPQFQQEGQALRAWRSLVWARCYELLGEVQAQTRPVPSGEELIALLPAFEL